MILSIFVGLDDVGAKRPLSTFLRAGLPRSIGKIKGLDGSEVDEELSSQVSNGDFVRCRRGEWLVTVSSLAFDFAGMFSSGPPVEPAFGLLMTLRRPNSVTFLLVPL